MTKSEGELLKTEPLQKENLEEALKTETGAEQLPEDNLPDKFKGKTPAEIARAYQELETHLGTRSNELDALKNEVGYYRQMMQQAQRPQPTREPEEENLDERFLEKPTETAEYLIQRGLQKQNYELAGKLVPWAKATAKAQFPQLFEGQNETEIDQMMYGGLQAGVLHPSVVSDPNTWAMVAWQNLGRKAGFKLTNPPPNPMNPPEGELPTQRKTQAAPTVSSVDPDVRAMWRKMGLTAEQEKTILEEMAKEKE